MYHVYILKSQKDTNVYIGCTSLPLEKRIAVHNSGTVKSTKYRRPLQLLYSENFYSKQEAYKREYYLKSPAGYLEKIEIIKGAVSSVD
ncbi:GIY-YIG nuclease family protein [Patescibacteria group bacterium]|nr:GIY-YIG nuclease family protein [Patescibacteria group bacterium]